VYGKAGGRIKRNKRNVQIMPEQGGWWKKEVRRQVSRDVCGVSENGGG